MSANVSQVLNHGGARIDCVFENQPTAPVCTAFNAVALDQVMVHSHQVESLNDEALNVVAVRIARAVPSPAHTGALKMASLGIPVFPLHGITPQGYCGCRLADQCKHPGKHPHHLGSINDATTDVDQINRWFHQVPTLNYGVQLGRELHDSGKMLVVIDVDGYKPGGTDALDALEATGSHPTAGSSLSRMMLKVSRIALMA